MTPTTKEEIRFEPESIPKHLRDSLACETLAFIRRLQSNPDTKAELERRVALRKSGKVITRTAV